MPFVVLPPQLVDECKQCAAQRDYNRRSSIDYSSDRTNDKSIWSFMGVLGEVALLRYFRLEIDWEYLSTDKGFCGVDVGKQTRGDGGGRRRRSRQVGHGELRSE